MDDNSYATEDELSQRSNLITINVFSDRNIKSILNEDDFEEFISNIDSLVELPYCEIL